MIVRLFIFILLTVVINNFSNDIFAKPIKNPEYGTTLGITKIITESVRRVPSITFDELFSKRSFVDVLKTVPSVLAYMKKLSLEVINDEERRYVAAVDGKYFVEEVSAAEGVFLLSLLNENVIPYYALVSGARVFVVGELNGGPKNVAIIIPSKTNFVDGLPIVFSVGKHEGNTEYTRSMVSLLGYAIGRDELYVSVNISRHFDGENRHIELCEQAKAMFYRESGFLFDSKIQSKRVKIEKPENAKFIESGVVNPYVFNLKERSLLAARICRDIGDDPIDRHVVAQTLNISYSKRNAAEYFVRANPENPVTAKRFKIAMNAIGLTLSDLSRLDILTRSKSLSLIYRDAEGIADKSEWDRIFKFIFHEIKDEYEKLQDRYSMLENQLFNAYNDGANREEISKLEKESEKMSEEMAKYVAAVILLPKEYCGDWVKRNAYRDVHVYAKAMSLVEMPEDVWVSLSLTMVNYIHVVSSKQIQTSANSKCLARTVFSILSGIKNQKDIPERIKTHTMELLSAALYSGSLAVVNRVLDLYEELLLQGRLSGYMYQLVNLLTDKKIATEVRARASRVLNALDARRSSNMVLHCDDKTGTVHLEFLTVIPE